MPIQQVTEFNVHINGRSPLEMAKGLVRLAQQTEGSPDAGKVRVLQEIEKGENFFPYGGRVISVMYDGNRYHLKYGIDRDKGWLAVSPGETPDAGPIKATAELWDRLIEELAK